MIIKSASLFVKFKPTSLAHLFWSCGQVCGWLFLQCTNGSSMALSSYSYTIIYYVLCCLKYLLRLLDDSPQRESLASKRLGDVNSVPGNVCHIPSSSVVNLTFVNLDPPRGAYWRLLNT